MMIWGFRAHGILIIVAHRVSGARRAPETDGMPKVGRVQGSLRASKFNGAFRASRALRTNRAQETRGGQGEWGLGGPSNYECANDRGQEGTYN